jgi:dinuclear metal center YbgI/SA1388 family protein
VTAPVTDTPSTRTARALAEELDALLRSHEIADYPGAFNGLQVDADAPVRAVAAAVDASHVAIEQAIAAGANFLLVHHGLFWGGARPVTGVHRAKLKALLDHDVAVYGTHLPLDAHPELGNNALLARTLGLAPSGRWLDFKGTPIGVTADCDLATADLVARATDFAALHGHHVVATPHDATRRTRRVALCTGAGASSDSIREALALGADTLVTGEGPHHTAVEARELGLVVVYAGHYATETLGVRALARWIADRHGIPAVMIDAPTGL